MVAKDDLLDKAAHDVDEALTKFVGPSAVNKVLVVVSEVGHLQALVGAGRFENMTFTERVDLQEAVWKHLREHVNPEYLAYLYTVSLIGLAEYDARTHEV